MFHLDLAVLPLLGFSSVSLIASRCWLIKFFTRTLRYYGLFCLFVLFCVLVSAVNAYLHADFLLMRVPVTLQLH